MKIGAHQLANKVVAAPMAGVTDKPYRRLSRQYGAAMTVSEMVTSQLELRHSTKSRFRMDFEGEPEPVNVQIVGTDPSQLAAAAKFNVENGAQIIDINMGCPAKKVCKKAAGSALLQHEDLVEDILTAVVQSVDVPVTVKIRTGTHPQQRNGVAIAKIAEQAGVSAITVHGRTRACKFVGAVEYDTIAAIKQQVNIPVIANGDITSPQQAQHVLEYTSADAVMIGRAAQGQPWLFQQIADYLDQTTSGRKAIVGPYPNLSERALSCVTHIREIHQFYGDRLGVKLARKHIKWYLQHWPVEIDEDLRLRIAMTEDIVEQLDLFSQFLFSTYMSYAA